MFQVIRSGRAGMVAANLALSAFQQRIAEQFDIEPGQEMRVAIKAAKEADLPLLLIDRDIGVTLSRVYRSVPWWQRLTLMAGIGASLFSNEEVTEEEIEKLKEGDMLEATFTEFAESSEKLYTPLIAERDAYMAAKLREGTHSGRDGEAPHYENVLVVIGAGHLKGLTTQLRDSQEAPEQVRTRLETLPKASILPKLLPWIIVGIILVGFVIGFLRSPDLGFQLVSDWFFINAILAGLGAAVALAHPLTVVGTFFRRALHLAQPADWRGLLLPPG